MKLLSFSFLLRALVHIRPQNFSLRLKKNGARYAGSTCLGLLFTRVLSALPVDHQFKATRLNMPRIT